MNDVSHDVLQKERGGVYRELGVENLEGGRMGLPTLQPTTKN